MIKFHRLPSSPAGVVEMEPLVEDGSCPSRNETPPREIPHNQELNRYSVPHLGLLMAVISSLFFSLCSLIVKVSLSFQKR